MRPTLFLCLVVVASLAAACRGPQPEPAVSQQQQQQTASTSELQKIQAMTARFAPVDIAADVSALPANERQALAKLVDAARVFDSLFLRQVWEGNETMLLDLTRDTSPLGRSEERRVGKECRSRWW